MTADLFGQLKSVISRRQGFDPALVTENQLLDNLIRPLFGVLGWQPDFTTEELEGIGLVVPLATNSHPLLLLKPLPVNTGGLTSDRFSRLLGNAYNRNVDWTLVADFNRIHVYQTRWLKAHTQASPSLVLDWSSPGSQIDRLSMLASQAIATGQTEEVIGAKDAETVLPIHEFLFRHFQRWRDELLQHSAQLPNATLSEVDDQIQRLFNQLVFLRSLEDSGRLHGPTLRGLYQAWESAPKTTEFTKALRNLVNGLGRRTQSRLFQWPAYIEPLLTDQVLTSIVARLYRVGLIIPINFREIKADILGGMYEHLLSYAAKQRASGQSAGQLQPKLIRDSPITVADVRKDKGIYFTPPSIAEYMASLALDIWYQSKTSDQIPTVLDFACGSGTFLVQALQALVARLRASTDMEELLASKLVVPRLFGVDISPAAVDDSIANIVHASGVPIEDMMLIERNFHVGNSLLMHDPTKLEGHFGADWLSKAPVDWNEIGPPSHTIGKFDVILANPPFRSTERRSDKQEDTYYEREYPVAQGRWDSAFLFVDLALRLIKDDGVIALVMPASVLKSDSASAVRSLIEGKRALFQAVDFTDRSVFPGVSTYIALLFLKPNWPGPVRYLEIREFPQTEAGRNWFLRRLTRGDPPTTMDVSINDVETPHNSGAPWVFTTGRERQLRQLMEQMALTAPCQVIVAQGVKTGSNRVFLVDEVMRQDGEYVAVMSSRGVRTLEAAYLRPAVLGEHIYRYGLRLANTRIIYPYDEHGTILPEADLKLRAPNIWAYLVESRADLTERRSLNKASDRWYSYIRPRGRSLQLPKILGPDYAQQSSFAYDASGAVIPIGGNAVTCDQLDQRVLLGMLNSSLMDWYIKRTSVRRRGAYYAFYGKFIEALPIVKPSESQKALQETIVQLVDRLLLLNAISAGFDTDEITKSRAAAESAEYEGQINELVLHLFGAYEYRDILWG